MDGGRVLCAFLARKLDYGRATRNTAFFGQSMAFFFGLVGLLYNPCLSSIAFVVYLGAAEELVEVEVELASSGLPISREVMTPFETLAPADPLSIAMARLLAGPQNDFPVLSGARSSACSRGAVGRRPE